jgi:hypothetical protein
VIRAKPSNQTLPFSGIVEKPLSPDQQQKAQARSDETHQKILSRHDLEAVLIVLLFDH